MSTYSADDLALAALLRIVPAGFRLVDVGDERFVGVREHFTRLALRHLGPRPALVGFVGKGQDPSAAALAASRWAGANLLPTAIQRTVSPGVVVIAHEPLPGTPVGMLPGAPVRTAIWTVEGGRVRTPGRPPGTPSPRLLRQAVQSLERGEPPPPIGRIDIAERALMTGRGSRRNFTLGSGASLGAVLVVLLLLRVLPGMLAGGGGVGVGRPAPGLGCPAGTACVNLGPGADGSTVRVPTGALVLVRLPAPGDGSDGCPRVSDPAVLQFQQCASSGGDQGEVQAVYRAAMLGTTTLLRTGYSVSVVVS